MSNAVTYCHRYISYVDSVPYLQSEPPDQRTPLYHAVINGYLRHAASRGFEYAHLWVAPPEEGAEYIFHCRVPEAQARQPMSKDTLRRWYEKMLSRAQKLGIVIEVSSLEKHLDHLTSVRDFPVFDGDLFPDKLPDILERASSSSTPPPLRSGGGKKKAA